MRQAATVVLLRRVPSTPAQIEVLLLERPAGAAFAPGTQVFPGGSVDCSDRDPRWWDLVEGWSDSEVDPRTPLWIRINAIRETYEETGVLLALRPDRSPCTPEDLSHLEPMRRGLRTGDGRTFRAGLAARGLLPDVRALVFCAHWITPAGLPRRFDTRFFLAELPEGQEPAPDPMGEHTGLRWAIPGVALEEASQGLCQLLPPTRAVLGLVASARGVADLLAGGADGSIQTIEPRLEDVNQEHFPGLDVDRVLGR